MPLYCFHPKPKTSRILWHFFHATTNPKSTPSFPPIDPRKCKSLVAAKLFHLREIIQGHAHHSLTDIIAAYLSCDAPSHALVFLQHLTPSAPFVFWWNTLIRREVHEGSYEKALLIFSTLRRLRWVPDRYTYPFVLKACGELPSFWCGVLVHGIVISTGFEFNVFVCNAIVAMYGRTGTLDDARKVFDELSERGIRDVVSWNSIVAAYVQTGRSKQALEVFVEMIDEYEIQADAVSLVNVLPAFASLGYLSNGKEVHGYVIRRELVNDIFVSNAVLNMYAKCGMMDDASKVFERMETKDVVSWNAMVTGFSQEGKCEDALSLFKEMQEEKIELNVVTWSAVIAGYAQRGQGYESLDVFRQMQHSGGEPNAVTLVSLLSGCASIGAIVQGKETHCYALKCILYSHGNDMEIDIKVINGLIDMYAKCKNTKTAFSLFNSVAPEDRNVVTWTVMIGGYAQHGEANDALELFSHMFRQDHFILPNAFTISCVLMACARLAALRLGKQVHAYVLRSCYESVMFLNVVNCLIDMYSKSGEIDTAQIIFDNMQKRNAVSWTTLMTGYGMHGRGEEALWIFDKMKSAGLVPDGITFLVVLYACSHSGMVDHGMKYFNTMEKEFGVSPRVEHYACMVDLLGRAGRMGEAMELIRSMEVDPTPVVWVALLSACRIHGNVELGEYAASQLSWLESENDGTYTLLSNIYANARRWKDVARIRAMMKHSGIRKRPGWSCVQGKKGTATFFVADRSHPRSQEIYVLLSGLIQQAKSMGYVPQVSFALHDVDDEEKGDLLFEHSEKLALAYGILTSTPGAPIRITKNLRVCGDCHTAITYISRIVEHEIILRDSSRFHHFKNGSCSCRGYW